MKILLVVGSSNVGGAEKQALLLAQNLSNQFEVTMLFLGPKGNLNLRQYSESINILESGGSTKSDLKHIFRTILQLKPNVQINFLYRADTMAGLVGKFLRVPRIINSARNTNWPKNTRIKRMLLKLSSKFVADYIVANSEKAKQWHEIIGYPSSKIHVIPNFIQNYDIDNSQSGIKFFDRPIRLGIASRAVDGKGHSTLIKAAEILQTEGINCELWFIGFGIPEWMENNKQLQKSTVRKNILPGKTDLTNWYKQIDIYCGVSESWESDSNSVNEAVLQNRPIILSDLFSENQFSPSPFRCITGSPQSVVKGIKEIVASDKSILNKELKLRRENLILTHDSELILSKWILLFANAKNTQTCI